MMRCNVCDARALICAADRSALQRPSLFLQIEADDLAYVLQVCSRASTRIGAGAQSHASDRRAALQCARHHAGWDTVPDGISAMQVPGVMRWVEVIEAFPTRFLFGSAVMGQFSDISGQHNACVRHTSSYSGNFRLGYSTGLSRNAFPVAASPSH